ncbi:MAG: hypothetical protein ACTSPY_10170 [Candidatus Helarchaeota archaeon]
MSLEDIEEKKEFSKGVRRYVAIRHVITYIIVFGVGLGSAWMLYHLLNYWFNSVFSNILWYIIFGFLFILAINIAFQQFLSFYHLPKHILDILDRTGFPIERKRWFVFFYKTKLIPTSNSWIKVGIKASYFPLSELRYESYRVKITSSKLCEGYDPLYTLIMKKIIEKNLLSISDGNKKRPVVYRKGSPGIRINIECGPEEVLSRVMIVGKAIREWESAINKLAEFSVKMSN